MTDSSDHVFSDGNCTITKLFKVIDDGIRRSKELNLALTIFSILLHSEVLFIQYPFYRNSHIYNVGDEQTAKRYVGIVSVGVWMVSLQVRCSQSE